MAKELLFFVSTTLIDGIQSLKSHNTMLSFSLRFQKKFVSMMKPLHIIAFSVLLGSCVPPDKVYNEDFTLLKTIETNNRELQEISGLVSSVRNPGYLWGHNDSGSDPSLFLLDSLGRIVLQVELANAKNRDWEDIAIDPGEMPKLFIGDIGDNRAVRNEIQIYKIDEPKYDESLNQPIKVQAEMMRIHYGDGARDAETLLYDTKTRELILLSKRDPEARIYAFQFQNSTSITMKPIGTMATTQLTAGDINLRGDILLKNYNEIMIYKGRNDMTAKELLLNGIPKNIAYKPEPQGEAIAWTLDGKGFCLISEWRNNQPQPLIYYR